MPPHAASAAFAAAALAAAALAAPATARNAPSAAEPGARFEAAAGLVGWLDDLLDTARERGDMALARSVAGVMDDLRNAGRA